MASVGNDLALRLWSLPELSLLDERPNAHNNWIRHLASAKLGETEALISSSESVPYHRDEPTAIVRLWNVKDLSLLQEIPRERWSFTEELKVFVFTIRQNMQYIAVATPSCGQRVERKQR